MARRGLTLVELLAALALVVVLSALAMPTFQGRLEEARFDAGKRQLEAAVMVCRAEAVRHGRPLLLVVRVIRAGERGLYMERVAPEAAIGAAGPEGIDAPDSPGGSGVPEGSGPAVESNLPTPVWAVMPGRVRVSNRPPEPDVGGNAVARGGKGAAVASFEGSGPGERAAEVRIAVFFPDGSALGSGPVYVTSGSLAVVGTINRWTGSVVFKPYAAEEGEPEPEEDRPTRPAADGPAGDAGEESP
jgi:prepilin-type N-terminal cleavage/methylation domain-containing protein